MKKILIILDGLGDLPYKELNNKTPLGAAKTPNMDFLAKNGKTGLLQPIKDIAPESGAAQFSILGYNLNKFPGRGPLEALGSGIKINKKNVYLRINFAKIKKNRISRTKIPNKNILHKLNKIDKDIKIIPTITYRGIMIVRNASPNISNTHPGYIKYKNFSKAVIPVPAKKICRGDKKTCRKINLFVATAEKIMKDKTILIRGAGNKLPKLKKLKNWSMIADMPVELGLGKLIGMKILKRRKNEIKQIIISKDNIYVQIKGPDDAGHKGDIKKKIKAIEKIDKKIKRLTELKNTIICITADHSTPCSLKVHSKHPVPLLIYGKGKDGVKKFSEKACKKGSLGLVYGKNLMELLK